MILSCPRCTKRFVLDAALLGSGRKVKCGNCGHVWHQTPPPPEARRPAARGAKTAPPPPPPPPPAESEDFGGFEGFGDDGYRSDPHADFQDDAPDPVYDPAPRSNSSGFASLVEDGDDDTAPMLSRFRAMGGGSDDSMDDEEEETKRSPRRVALLWGGLAVLWLGVAAGLWFGREAILQAWPASAALYDLIGRPPEPLGAGLSIPQERARVEVKDVEGIALLMVSGEIVNDSDRPRDVPDVLAEARDTNGATLWSWVIEPEARRLMPGQTVLFQSQVPEGKGQAAQIHFLFVTPGGPAPELVEGDAGATDQGDAAPAEQPAAEAPAPGH